MSTLLQGISRVCRLNVFAASRIPPFYLVKHQTPQFSSNIENYNIDKVDISDEEWRQRVCCLFDNDNYTFYFTTSQIVSYLILTSLQGNNIL